MQDSGSAADGGVKLLPIKGFHRADPTPGLEQTLPLEEPG